MAPRAAILGAIQRAGAFLAKAQESDGSFTSLSSTANAPFEGKATLHTTFAPAIMLGALAGNPDPGVQAVCRRLSAWLLEQKSRHWSFNYWARSSAEYGDTPYPDDLDDTFCALIGLHRYDAALTDETCLGHVVRLLLAAESQVGGPYRTWLAAADAAPVWRDIDLAVNSNVACFLQTVAQPLPNLTALMEQAIASQTFGSPYYPSEYPLLYYIARAYQGPQRQTLARHLLGKGRGGHWQTPLQTALALSALLALETDPSKLEPAVHYLIKTQLPDGSWPAEAFWMDTTYHGAAALSTALAVEALHRYTTAQAAAPVAPAHQPPPLYGQIMAATRDDLRRIGQPLRAQTSAMLDTMGRAENSQEIVLLPYFFAAIAPNVKPAAMHQLCRHLGQANLYGWMAYTIYDDFLDDEGRPELLPVANLALRRSLASFRQALPNHEEFQALVERTFDAIDTANTWEVAHCRLQVLDGQITVQALPRYKSVAYLAERSIGHALTPLGVLAAAGQALDSPAARELLAALKHYLAARQLHDDAHDWQQDLRAGHCSYVVTELLNSLPSPTGTHQLDKLIPQLQQQFWHRTLPVLCTAILRQLGLARRAWQRSGLAGQAPTFQKLLDRLEASVRHTQSEQAGAEKFLAAYQKTS